MPVLSTSLVPSTEATTDFPMAPLFLLIALIKTSGSQVAVGSYLEVVEAMGGDEMGCQCDDRKQDQGGGQHCTRPLQIHIRSCLGQAELPRGRLL